jgi:predicted MFS family arabinose efflux permease
LIAIGFGILSAGGSRNHIIVSAIIFGVGFGSAYPVFLAHVLRNVEEHRRGAMFGSIIGAFDTGIGTGSIAMGSIIQHYGYRTGWATAAALAVCAIPYFLAVEPRVMSRRLADAA